MSAFAKSSAPLVTKAQHTPGPWVQNEDEQHYIADADIVVGSVDEGKLREVCIVSEWDCDLAEAKANARLITAAPDLLASLKEMLEIYWGAGDGQLPEPACILTARAAITKAGAA